MDAKQRHGHAQPQDPAQGGKQRHVHVVEHEDLVAQHGQAVEVFRPLLVGDRRHRGLEARHVGLEGDRDLVAKAALHPGADGAHKPGRGGRNAEAQGRCLASARCGARRKPLPSSINHSASSASGSADSWDSTNDTTIRRGSWR